MQVLSLCKKSVQFVDRADTKPPQGWVVVGMKAVPICGSDKGAYYSDSPCDWGGHEGAGVVLESNSPLRKVGDRVALWPLTSCGTCRECLRGDDIYCKERPTPIATQFADKVLKPGHLCMPIPDDVSFEVGSMACCALGPSFGAARRLGLTPADTLLITGLGPVGLGASVVAKFFGARVIAIEMQEWRRQRAQEIGVDVVLDPSKQDVAEEIKKLTQGHGVDKAFDCSGNPQAQRLCIDATGIRGGVAFIGENDKDFAIKPSPDFIRKGLTLIGSWHFNRTDFPLMAELLRRSPVVSKLISHTFPFAQAQTAFTTFFESGKAAKVVMTL